LDLDPARAILCSDLPEGQGRQMIGGFHILLVFISGLYSVFLLRRPPVAGDGDAGDAG
jgi:hypothetical protein